MTLEELLSRLGDKFVEKVDEQLKDLITKNPEFTYNPGAKVGTCSYIGPHRSYDHTKEDWVVDGPECSGCIFGQAFQQLGWTPEDIKKDIHTLCIELDIKAPARWFNMQRLQDIGEKWGALIALSR